MPEQRILLVEDLPRWQATLGAPLVEAGYAVDMAGNLSEALTCLDSRLYHVAIVDIRLDDGNPENSDGMIILEQLTERFGESETVATIVISGYPNNEQIRQAFRRHRVFDYLFKREFSRSAFLNTVRDAFDRQVRVNPNLEITLAQNLSLQELVSSFALHGEGGAPIQVGRARLVLELEDLFRRLFYDKTRIVIERVTAGHGKAGVVKVIPFSTGSHDEPVILKFGDYKDIDREYRNYEQFVKGKIGTQSTQVMELRRTPMLGGIVYSFIGAPLGRVRDLESYYQAHTAQELLPILDDLFKGTCHNWYLDRGAIQYVNLSHEYSQALSLNDQKLTVALRDQFPSMLEGRTFDVPELPGVRVPNPLHALRGRSFEQNSFLCTTHGDLNANNVFVDESAHTWLIDFYWTGKGLLLRDCVRLETVVKFSLLQQSDLAARYELERALAQMERFRDVEYLSFDTADPALRKAFEVCRKIRSIARELVQPSDDFSEYEIGLLYTTLNVQRFYDLPRVNRLHALLAAGILCEKRGLSHEN